PRVHASTRLRLRGGGGGGPLWALGSQLGDHPGRPRQLEPRRYAAATACALLRGPRRYLRRQARGRNRTREFFRAEGEAARGDDETRAQAHEAQSQRGALHQGGDPRGALYDRQAGARLSEIEAGFALAQRQGDPRTARHEAVFGREV